MPYLRVDIGFEEESDEESRFKKPGTDRIFSADDFGPHIEFDGLSNLLPGPGEPKLNLVLWVTNKQVAPLGAAFQVRVGLYIAWGSDATQVTQVDVRFAYVEPGATTAIRIARLRTDVQELTISVFAVSYYGMYLDRELINRHGALSLYYDSQGGAFRHDRSFGLGEAS